MKYNFDEYIELLNYQEALKKDNKSLRTQDPVKDSKLRKYAVILTDHLHWSQKNQYLQLIKDFLNCKIDAQKFDSEFSIMVEEIEKNYRLLSKNYEELKRIEPSSISLGFGTWISEIYLYCNEFYSDFNEEEERADIPFAKTEAQLRDAVKSLVPEIQKYF